jgi:FMN phosphatase YigB (HAD superfamily)
LFDHIELNNVKGVLLDLDNTLYSYEPSHNYAIKACYALFGTSLSFQDFSKLYREHRTHVTKSLSPQGACRSRLLAFQGLFEELEFSDAPSKALTFSDMYWDSFISSMRIFTEAKVFLEQCSKQNIPVCIVSDMLTHTQIRKLIALKIDTLITYLVTSELAGVEKPHPNIFKLALKKLGLGVQDVIMIGDHDIKDVKGAQDLGIKAYHISC